MMERKWVICAKCGARICHADLSFSDRMARIHAHHRKYHGSLFW